METLIRECQGAYYASLGQADGIADAMPVILFLLTAIRDALNEIALTTPASTSLTPSVQALLNALGADTLTANELMAKVGLKSRPTFRMNYLNPALEQGLVEMTVPGKPNSRNQQYRKCKR